MPWECATCNTEALSDSVKVCPNCNTEKLAWTINPNQTRTLQMTSRRTFEVRRGEGAAPLAAGASYAKVVTSEAERVLVVPKQRAREYAQAGKLPPPDQVCFVRLFPDKWAKLAEKLTLVITPELELKGIDEAKVEVPQASPPALQGTGYFDVRLLFVFGEGAVDFEFAGLQVVDLSEGTARGHAGKVGFEALKKKRRVLLCDPLEKGWCRRLECKQLQFNHDSHLLLPEGLPVLALVMDQLQAHPEEKLLIVGHADATGESRGYDNLGLSQRRAQNIVCLLAGEEDAWAESALACRQHLFAQKTPQKAALDVQMVEDWVGVKPGEGFAGFKQLASLRLKMPLTAASWDELPPWKAVYRFYDQALRDQVASPILSIAKRKKIQDQADRAHKDPRALAKTEGWSWGPTQRAAQLEQRRAGVRKGFVDPNKRTLGCGARYLKIQDDGKNETNRRDEFLFFRPDALPFAAGSSASEEELAAAVYGPQATWNYVRSDGPYTFDRLDCPPEPLIKPPEGDVVVVVDVSGSMTRGTDPGRDRNRLELCREQLYEFVNALERTQRFTIVPFATNVLTPWRPVLVPANLPNRQSALDWLNLELWNPPEDMTNTAAALKYGLEFEEANALVFLSDGLPTVSTVHEPTILKVLKRHWNVPKGKRTERTRIYCYGFLINPADLGATPALQTQVRARFKADWLDQTKDLTKTVKDGVVRKIASDLKLTSEAVEALILGDFMFELATQNGGQFYDLNDLLDAAPARP